MTQTTNKPRSYRASFIIDTRNNQEPIEAVIDSLKEAVSAIGGAVKDVEDLGQKDFVRVTDRAFPSGFYLRVHFDGPAASAKALAEKLRLDRRVNRLIVQSA